LEDRATPTTYTFTDFRSITGPQSIAYGINNQTTQEIVGIADNAGYSYVGGAESHLANLNGAWDYGIAYAVNNSGLIVGSSTSSAGPMHATMWGANGVPTDIGGDSNYGGSGTAVNANGVIAGYLGTEPNGYANAIRWVNGVQQDLGTLGGNTSQAWGVDPSGNVVGVADRANGTSGAFYYNGTTHLMSDLGTLGGQSSIAHGINGSGQIVGMANTAGGNQHAFLYQNGAMTDLGTLTGSISSYAYAINNSGQVVGQSGNAMIWQNGVMTNLNTLVTNLPSGYTLLTAYGINDAGQIVGVVQEPVSPFMKLGYSFLLTPNKSPGGAAPLQAHPTDPIVQPVTQPQATGPNAEAASVTPSQDAAFSAPRTTHAADPSIGSAPAQSSSGAEDPPILLGISVA
jgi:probable HAF family extracellular repeat protein